MQNDRMKTASSAQQIQPLTSYKDTHGKC